MSKAKKKNKKKNRNNHNIAFNFMITNFNEKKTSTQKK